MEQVPPELLKDLNMEKLAEQGFTVGPMTFTDVMRILFNTVRTYADQQIIGLKGFVEELKQGKSSAITITGLTIVLGLWFAYLIMHQLFSSPPKKVESEEEKKEEPIVLRDFTIDQLKEYTGANGKPIYVGLCGDVFDVSAASNYYGPSGWYNCFAGRNASRAMAKYCFDEVELNNPKTDDLGPFERSMLQDWYNKFKYYKCYPVVGKLSYPPNDLQLSKEELLKYDGTLPVPEGRIDSPIYISLKGKIFDVSYGGKEMYDADGPYHKFAGKDVSRALARMSFEAQDIDSMDLSDLTEEQQTTLNQWIEKYENAKKYPVVGTLVASKESEETAVPNSSEKEPESSTVN